MVTLYKNGESHREISKKVGFTFSAVQYVIKHFFATKSLENDYCNSRPKMLNLTQSRSLIWNLQKNPLKSALSLTADLVFPMGVTDCQEGALFSQHGRYPQKKPFISEANCVKRLTFAKEYVNTPSSFWQIIIFSDEMKYNLFRSDGCGHVWRKKLVLCEPKIYYPCKIWGRQLACVGCMAASDGGNLVFIDRHMTAMMFAC